MLRDSLRIYERNYPAHDLELAAVVFALEICKHYLYGRKCQTSLSWYWDDESSVANRA